MAISLSRPDPSSPASVSSAQFATGRKGFDQAEVRDFLRMVAAEMARLQERERYLDREVKAERESKGSGPLDEETATRMLGEEAARIISTAREAAAQIRARAEDGSARLLREATDEAQRMREEAEIESARRRQDASADAEAEINMAKQQGRDMVNEARAYRERVLSELARRRELARQQIEQLIHGRDRLLQAFERSRIAAVEVMAELTPLGEPNEYVNLQPTTGPVPMMLPNLGRPMRIVEDTDESEPEPMPDAAVDVNTTAADGAGLAGQDEEELEPVRYDPPHMYDVSDEDDDGDESAATVVPLDSSDDDDDVEDELQTGTDSVIALPDFEPSDLAASDHDREPAPVVSLFPGEPEPAKASVDDLFARLRAAKSSTVADRAKAATDFERPPATDFVIHGDELEPAVTALADAPATDDAASAAEEATDLPPVSQIDEVVVPLIVSAARKLKRVLADEQNEVLDTLRRKEPVRAIDTLLPWEAEQADRYAKAIEGDLVAAAIAGANGDGNGRNPAIVRPAYDAVTNEIVAPLRERLTRCIDKAEGSNTELANQVRSLYREWKSHRIDEHVEDIVRLAYDRGALTVSSR